MASGESVGFGCAASKEQEGDRAQADRGYQASIAGGATWLMKLTARMIAHNKTLS
jgi:hypothetical protein